MPDRAWLRCPINQQALYRGLRRSWRRVGRVRLWSARGRGRFGTAVPGLVSRYSGGLVLCQIFVPIRPQSSHDSVVIRSVSFSMSAPYWDRFFPPKASVFSEPDGVATSGRTDHIGGFET